MPKDEMLWLPNTSKKNLGQVVGYYTTSSTTWRPCLWEKVSGAYIVRDLGTLAGDTEGVAYDINDSGLVVGDSWLSSPGDDRAVLWNPVPEPSSLLVLGSGILALAGMVRRRRNG